MMPLDVENPDKKWMQRVWNFCVENNLRFSLQAQKIVFGNKKGV
jgi:hypothetical protein